MNRGLVSEKKRVIVVSILLIVALLALAGAASVAIARIATTSIELTQRYGSEIIFMAAMAELTILAIGTVGCIGLAREIKRLWQLHTHI